MNGSVEMVTISSMFLRDLPAVGTEWSGQGGIFAGLVRGENGARDYLLILGPEYDGETDWNTAMAWASGLDVGSHRDYSLPTRAEQAVLFGNLRDQFQRDWYWSNTQHAEYADFAWCQGFGYGDQDLYPKGRKRRARAVRRLPI